MLTPEQLRDDDLRDALQGMRQPQPGVVLIADVLAYVEPRLAVVRQLTEDRDRARAEIAAIERRVSELRRWRDDDGNEVVYAHEADAAVKGGA